MVASRDQRNSVGRGRGEAGQRTFSIQTIGKIMKKVLPQKARITTEVKETIEQCLTEFVAFITSEAAEKCNNDNRFMLTGDDIVWALARLGFDNYVEPLQIYLHRYREPDYEAANWAELDTSISAVPVWQHGQISDGDYQNGILGVGTVEDFQDLPAVILMKIY
ncbi:transcriptional activator hap3-like [Prosopis cineraria]|uniref:transcriptional activator hap3-like n=1 Tax=Prosopis cineraria TaxID=364024 RepID=UPI00240F0CF0|nr:transcriptional activator hap3-like [Prosopis cineraria]XP_054795241.1 transcriptional activator hap3-like [Prosopis cineraria]